MHEGVHTPNVDNIQDVHVNAIGHKNHVDEEGLENALLSVMWIVELQSVDL